MVRRLLADAPGHGAVLGHGVLQQVAHHGVLVDIAVGVDAEVVVDLLEGLGAVVIVGVDDGEGAVHHAPGRQGRLGGAPGLGPIRRGGVALRQVVPQLVDVLHVHALLQAAAHPLLEVRLDLRLDDEHHRLKPRPAGIVDRVVQDHLIVVPHRVQLLESAVAAAHAGSHDDQYWFLVHFFALLIRSPPLRGLHLPSILYAGTGNGNRRSYTLFVRSSGYTPLSSESIFTLRSYSLGDMPVAWRKRREK